MMKNKLASLSLISVILLGGCQTSDLPFIKGDKTEEKEQAKSKDNKVRENRDFQNTINGQAHSSMALPAGSFNVTNDIKGKRVIQNSDNLLVLVNKQYTLPDDYAPDDLVKPNVKFSFGDSNEEKSFLREPAARALEEMFDAAKADGIELYAVSGYRSYTRQELLFQSEIDSVGKEKAIQAVAFPGTSEHQTGLAMDISSKSSNLLLTESFENVPEGKWLFNNSYRFGFILRYPQGKEIRTGYQYEPWHYRYVGKEIAKTIYQKHYTLEEFFKVVKKI